MKLNITVAEMVKTARANIREIETDDAIKMVDDPTVVIVDIRDPRERQRTGAIPGSFSCPRGMVEFWVDPQSPYFKEVFAEDKTFVFHCASGWRSALTVETLQNMGATNVAHVKDGFGGWSKANGPVEPVEK